MKFRNKECRKKKFTEASVLNEYDECFFKKKNIFLHLKNKIKAKKKKKKKKDTLKDQIDNTEHPEQLDKHHTLEWLKGLDNLSLPSR